jgi:hypothetical protein
MKKRDIFNDLKRLITDLEKQEESTVARVEEKEVNIGGKKEILKTETVFRARTGLPGSSGKQEKRVETNENPRNRLKD